jgi:hypothetical protein
MGIELALPAWFYGAGEVIVTASEQVRGSKEAEEEHADMRVRIHAPRYAPGSRSFPDETWFYVVSSLGQRRCLQRSRFRCNDAGWKYRAARGSTRMTNQETAQAASPGGPFGAPGAGPPPGGFGAPQGGGWGPPPGPGGFGGFPGGGYGPLCPPPRTVSTRRCPSCLVSSHRCVLACLAGRLRSRWR